MCAETYVTFYSVPLKVILSEHHYTLAKALTQPAIGKMFLCCCHFIYFREIAQIFSHAKALQSCSALSSRLWIDLHQ